MPMLVSPATVTLTSEGVIGAATPTSGQLSSGTDGTNLRGFTCDTAGNQIVYGGYTGAANTYLLTDTTSRPIVVGASADGAALAGNPVRIAGSDGTNTQDLIVESAANPNLRTREYAAANPVTIGQYNADSLAATGYGKDSRAFTYELNGTTWDRTRHKYTQTAAGITANGAGTTISLTQTTVSKFTLQVVRTAGASAYVVALEGSINGTNWVPIGTLSSSAATDMVHVVNKALTNVRYNVTTVGAGNTLTTLLLASAR